MAGDEATVAKHSLTKQDWLCQDFILPIYIVIGTSNKPTTTTDAKKNKESTNRANLAKEGEMSSVYLCS